jgi:7-cyano-7-deazaguanine synthase in queuosine biosynthesis
MANKILMMYSGGLDSAGALWELISNPSYHEYTILVHHIHILNHENRALAEKIAVDKTLALFQQHTSKRLYFSTTTIDFRCLPFPSDIPFDTDIYGFVAGNLTRIDQSIRYIASGSTADDAINQEANQSFDTRRDAIIQALYLGTGKTPQCTMLYPVSHLSKAEIYAQLPAAIRAHTWSCRRPNYVAETAQPCGQCHSCQTLAKLTLS